MNIAPVKVVDIELSLPITTLEGLQGYLSVKGLVRLHGAPVGYVDLPVVEGLCPDTAIRQAILAQHGWTLIHRHLTNFLESATDPADLQLADLANTPAPIFTGPTPLVTVAVCTRNRSADLALCLEALHKLDYPALDLLVVDNAPSDDATLELVRTQFPHVRYVREARPGLDWARNRALHEARGEIIAYTDDDVMVDAGWVSAIARLFVEHPDVMAVTGLVVPYELEAESQVLFEMYGGFGRGFERKWYRIDQSRDPRLAHGAGRFGTGANMAYRRSVFDIIGPFDHALDVGTVTNGGGDLEMFFRVLKEGFTLVYEPCAIVRHRHRRDYAQLRTQLANNGVGLYSYFVRSALAYPEERRAFLRFGIWWFVHWDLRRLVASFLRPSNFPRDLIWAELWGVFAGLVRYQRARKTALNIARASGEDAFVTGRFKRRRAAASQAQDATAVRTLDLRQPLAALTDVSAYRRTRVFVTWGPQPLGAVEFTNGGQPISVRQLRESIVMQLGVKVLEVSQGRGNDQIWAVMTALLHQQYGRAAAPDEEFTPLAPTVPVSIIIGTYDRPDDLHQCLHSLTQQATTRPLEIVVVDNNPTSGLTPPVVAAFPGVILVREARKGVAYARNAGINAARGEIMVTIDDDITVPPDWLEKLLAPFTRPDIMAVTGNILPGELETPSQHFFEAYGGLGRGFSTRTVDRAWFNSFRFKAVPTWELGGTANAAFRAAVFAYPQIGLMDEALGPGMPSGVGEDIYLFYKILKAGGSIRYEASAYVWHKHRRTDEALRRQLYNYSKGFVCYHLTTLVRDHDYRALVQLGIELPRAHLWRIKERLRRRSGYPITLVLREIAGNLAGPRALAESRRRVQREGRSGPFVPAAARSGGASQPSLHAEEQAAPLVLELEPAKPRVVESGDQRTPIIN